jgi:hypothetical protein
MAVELEMLAEEWRTEVLAQGAAITLMGPVRAEPWGAPGAVVEVIAKFGTDYIVDDAELAAGDEVLSAVKGIAETDPAPLWLLLNREGTLRPLINAIVERIGPSAPVIRCPVPPGGPPFRDTAAAA